MSAAFGRIVLILGLFALSLPVAGCMAKARTLHVAVNEFKNESTAAIDSIDAMWRAEIAPPPQSQAAAADAFVERVLSLDSEVTGDTLPIILDPYSLSPEEYKALEEKWGAFLGDLRMQYLTFASIFENVERASFTGRSAIEEAKPHVERLTAQLAYFAQTIEDAPPRLIQHRNALLQRLNEIQQGSAPEGDKRKQIALWRDDWLAMEAAENDLRDRTVRQCIKAALIGKTVRDQIGAYGDLTLQDLVEAINLGFQVAQSVTGDDYASLRSRTQEITQSIEADPVWKNSVDEILRQIGGMEVRS